MDGVLLAGVISSFILIWLGVSYKVVRKWDYIFKILPIFVGLSILLYTFTFETQTLNIQSNNLDRYSNIAVLPAISQSTHSKIFITYFNNTDGSLWMANDTDETPGPFNYTMIAQLGPSQPAASSDLATQQMSMVIWFYYIMIIMFLLFSVVEMILMLRESARNGTGLWKNRMNRLARR